MTTARLFLAHCLIWLLTLTSTAAEASRVTTVGCIGSSGFGCAVDCTAASSCATGLGCVAAAGLATHGADIAGHGVVQLWTGEVTDTFGGGLLQQAGLSPAQAELVYGFMGAGIEIVALRAMLHAPATITPQALATYQRTGVLPEGVATNNAGFRPFRSTETEYSTSTRTYEGSDVVELEISGNPQPFLRAEIVGRYSDGDLRIDFYQTDVRGQSIGTELISNAIETVGPNRVATVSGELGLTNRSVYLDAIGGGASPVDAAWSTPLGRSMSELGFTSVEITPASNPRFVFGFD